MAHVAPIVQAVIDDPRRDGVIERGGLGLLKQLRFNDRDEQWADVVSKRPSPEWDLTSGGYRNVEIIAALRAAGPKASLYPANMVLGTNWVVSNHLGLPNCSNDRWQTVNLPHLRDAFGNAVHGLRYTDKRVYSATEGYFGEVVSTGSLGRDPGFILRCTRSAPAEDLAQDRFTYIEVQLLGDALTGQWGLRLPRGGVEKEGRTPRLFWRLTETDEWEDLAAFRKAQSAAWGKRTKDEEFAVVWETARSDLLLNIDGDELVFEVPTRCRSGGEAYAVEAGRVRLRVYGHAATLNFAELAYPMGDDEACLIEWAGFLPIDNTLFAPYPPTMRALAWEPPGTSAAPGCTRVVDDAEDQVTPKVTFTSADPRKRALAYLWEGDWAPVIAAGTTDPWDSDGENVIVKAHGELTNAWRDANCVLTLQVDRTAIDAMPTWRGNDWVQVTAGRDEGGVTNTAIHFTGSVVDPSHVRRGGKPELVELAVPCKDGFWRLQHKFWQHLASFAGRDLGESFYRVLNGCGIPDSLIDATLLPEGTTIPQSDRYSDARFDFPDSMSVPEGLNQLVAACGMTWGADQEGTWFCRPPVEYGGVPDFILEDEPLSEEDVAVGIVARSNIDTLPSTGKPMANCVYVRVDRGSEQWATMVFDDDSWHTAGTARFIGDDWWAVIVGGDIAEVLRRAQLIMADRGRRSRTLSFEFPLNGQVNLWPDSFVECRMTGLKIVYGSIFRVTRKTWEADGDRNTYGTNFEAVLEQ